ncbi:MAG: right-handed parallel beta-helix repeat-containing protein [Planctomycetes bacterium]|nr:right-handed parallel beta-helix repeat-containing protein [Planctomycetota bacterium]HPF13940.1 right-handed parallel beta-helix repeat-containing protein [Planctomycetota bacterium]HRV80779.1 right-handed parallel beta-helix repeat-containing protein [Planctomycetota bacterium]
MKKLLQLLGLIVASSPALANDLPILPGQSIQSAIESAVDGDRVLVAPGTYLETLNLLGKAIEIVGTQGAASTIVDANYLGQAIVMTQGEGPGTVLRGLTITHGSGGYGPGGVVTNGNPTLEDCVIAYNSGRAGAGVRGNPRLVRCRIEHNTSSLNHGGGVYGAPTMVDCVVAHNSCTSANGGGLYLTGGNAMLSGCQIVGNQAVLAGSRGGGIYVHSSASVTLDRCVISDNLCSGGVFGSYGGGVYATANTLVMRSTIAANRLATGNGNRLGGGAYGAGTLVDCIVVGNDASQLEAVGPVSYSNIEGGFPGAGNFDADPLFWSPLQGDFHLMPGSPCIDAGDPASPLDSDGSRGDVGAYAFDPAYGQGPTVECLAVANSTGAGAAMDFGGSWSVSANGLVLRTSGCPANQFGLYFYGPDAAQVAVPMGYLCISGPLTRLPVVQSDALGNVQYALDLQNLPPGASPIQAGSTWRFQLWYRDNGGASFFSNALAVPFVD